tara:strand:+ start:46 stop:1848 length:1803 start_codon:yes stop_codon:yes gene_type:complete
LIDLQIIYGTTQDFEWTVDTAQKEILKYLLSDYSVNDYNLDFLPKRLAPDRMEKINKTNTSRDFGKVAYTKVLKEALLNIKTVKLKDINIQLTKETKDILKNIDTNLTIGELSIEGIVSRQLGTKGGNLEMMNKLDAGFNHDEITKQLKKAVNREVYINGEGTLRSWHLRQEVEDKVKKIKSIGFKQITIKDSGGDKQPSRKLDIRQTKGKTLMDDGSSVYGESAYSAKTKDTLGEGEGSPNPLDFTGGREKAFVEAAKATFNARTIKDVELADTGMPPETKMGEATKRFKLWVNAGEALLKVIDNFFEYEDDDTKASKETRTGVIARRTFNEKTIHLLEQQSDKMGKLAKDITESAKQYDAIVELQDRLEEWEIDKDTSQFESIVKLVKEAKLKVDIKEIKAAKKLSTNKTSKFLDKLFKDIDKQASKKEEKFVKMVGDLELDLKAKVNGHQYQINRFNKLLNLEIKAAVDTKQGNKAKGKEGTGSSDLRNYNKEGKKIYEDIEDYARKHFAGALTTLKASYLLTLQVMKKDDGKYKVKVIEDKLLKNILVSSVGHGNTAKRAVALKGLSSNEKYDLNLLIKTINKQYRKINKIKGISG